MKFGSQLFTDLRWLKVGTKLAIFKVIILDVNYVSTVYPIGLSFGTFVNYYHINVYIQEHFHNCFTFGITGAQSWSKSRNLTIFTIFAIFGRFWIFVLRATFGNGNLYISNNTISSLGNNYWASWVNWSFVAWVLVSSVFDTLQNDFWKNAYLYRAISQWR